MSKFFEDDKPAKPEETNASPKKTGIIEDNTKVDSSALKEKVESKIEKSSTTEKKTRKTPVRKKTKKTREEIEAEESEARSIAYLQISHSIQTLSKGAAQLFGDKWAITDKDEAEILGTATVDLLDKYFPGWKEKSPELNFGTAVVFYISSRVITEKVKKDTGK